MTLVLLHILHWFSCSSHALLACTCVLLARLSGHAHMHDGPRTALCPCRTTYIRGRSNRPNRVGRRFEGWWVRTPSSAH